MAPPRILVIAGSDSSGGAGIEADQKVIAAHKCYAMTATTALTVQDTLRVRKTMQVYPHIVKGQIEASMEDIGVDVVKIGMLTMADTILEVAKSLKKYGKQTTVVDPVMVSTTGAELLPTVAVSYLRDLILPLATILTPNVPEALKLLEYAHKTQPRLASLQDMVTLAKRTLQLGSTYVLLKGGHLPLTAEGKVAGKVEERQMVVNVLCNKQNTYILKMDYLDAKNTHGTGCSLASAIACNLALSQCTDGDETSMLEAVEKACRYVEFGIRTAPDLGRGNGPINHFHCWDMEQPGSLEEPKDLSLLPKSTLRTELWQRASVENLSEISEDDLHRVCVHLLDEVYDQVLDGIEDSPKPGDLYVRTPPPKRDKVAEKKAEKEVKEDTAWVPKEPSTKSTRKGLAEKLPSVASKGTTKKPASAANTTAAKKSRSTASKKPLKKSTTVATQKPANKPPRTASKTPRVASKDSTKKPVRSSRRTPQQQTVKEVAGRKGDVEASESDEEESEADVESSEDEVFEVPLPTNRSAKAVQQKLTQEAGREASEEVEVVGEKARKKQVAGPSTAPALKPATRLRLTMKGAGEGAVGRVKRKAGDDSEDDETWIPDDKPRSSKRLKR